jgi:lysozyme family protein
MTVDRLIKDIIAVEGGYVFDKSDSGGETCWGITVATARAAGYKGNMKDLSQQQAYDIYYKQYVVAPGFDKVLTLSEKIAAELVDTGVNMGVSIAGKFLQQSLNALNDQATQYPDLVVDGGVGKASISALQAFLAKRGADGEGVMLRALNALQGARYISIAEASPKNERFLYGWFLNRVKIK